MHQLFHSTQGLAGYYAKVFRCVLLKSYYSSRTGFPTLG